MGNFTNSKIVKTRKEHRCGFCNRIIPKGFKVKFLSGYFEDSFFNSYLDDFCDNYIDLYWEEYSCDGFNEDDFNEIDTWFNYGNCCERIIKMIDNDIKNKEIVFECVDCEKEFRLSYDEALKLIKNNKEV